MKKTIGLVLACLLAVACALPALANDDVDWKGIGMITWLRPPVDELSDPPMNIDRIVFMQTNSTGATFHFYIPEGMPDAEAWYGKAVRYALGEEEKYDTFAFKDSIMGSIQVYYPETLEIIGDTYYGWITALTEDSVTLKVHEYEVALHPDRPTLTVAITPETVQNSEMKTGMSIIVFYDPETMTAIEMTGANG